MKSKKKMLIISDYFIPHWTGIASSVYRLTQVIKDFVQITVLTVKHEPKLSDSETINNLNIVRVKPTLTISRSKYSILFPIISIKYIFQADLILINSPCANIVPIAILAKLLRKKLFILHHGDLILPRSFANLLIEKIFDLSSNLAFSLSNVLITYTRDYALHSRVLQPHLKKLKTMIIPPLKTFKNRVKPIPKLDHLRSNHKYLCGFAGRFVEEKGFDILFQAIPLVQKEIPQAHFVYAGETKIFYENFFKSCQNHYQKVKSNITMLGLLSQPEMAYFYQNIDLIVIPSRSDCFPFVQVEAMTLGTPSVVSNIPGARDVVKQTSFGVISPPNNPHALAEKIVFSLTHLPSFQKHYPLVEKYFDYEANQQAIRNTFGI